MHPLLLQVGSFQLRSYDAFVALGGVVALIFLKLRERELGLREDADFWVLVNTIIASGFIGARVYAMVLNVPSNSGEFSQGLFSINREFSVFGFIAGIFITVYFFSRIHKIRPARLLDYICLVILIWQVFGRLGCFMNGCCFGRRIRGNVPWAVTFTNPNSAVPEKLLGVRLHPAQLYEVVAIILLGIVLLYILLAAKRRRFKPGFVCAGYCAGYGLIRFFNEWFRGDTLVVRGTPVTVGQASSVALILLGILFVRLTSDPSSSESSNRLRPA